MRGPVLLLLALVALATVAVPTPAGAAYGNAADQLDGAQLVSADYARLEQGDDSTLFAAVAAGGRYVAFQTRARNFFADGDADPPDLYRAGGIFRFDLETRALEKVADGDLFDEGDGSFVRRGASNPSLSADGRYVAFSTAQSLVAADLNDNVDVYVRDMTRAAGAAGAFELVSVRDGGDLPAAYAPSPVPLPSGAPGAEVSRGVAISSDGSRVVFRTTADSDLPAAAAAEVPAGQVFVRDRVAKRTTLVTALRDPDSGAMTTLPAGGALGAALSADGSTVAWTGSNARAQSRFLAGEPGDASLPFYLWRRIGDGPGAPTRRITGAADPDDPACPPPAVPFFDQTSTGPCFGPLTDPEGIGASIAAQLPALDGDGGTVAFLTGSGPRPNSATGFGLDLFVTEMGTGGSRKQATVELTRETLGNQPDSSPPIESVAISAGGRYAAITTVRTRFALPALQLLGTPRPVPGARELYVIDLQDRTLERAARSASGGDIDGSVQTDVTISADGSRIAFTSFSASLFFGDANQRADAFVATRGSDLGLGGVVPGRGGGGSGGTVAFGGGPQIGVRARSRAGGAIELTVSVPAAGGVKAVGRARAGEPRKLRTLGTAAGRARGKARTKVRLTLRPVQRYRDELREREAIPGRVAVTYVAARGGRRAKASVGVVYREEIGARKPARGGRK